MCHIVRLIGYGNPAIRPLTCSESGDTTAVREKSSIATGVGCFDARRQLALGSDELAHVMRAHTKVLDSVAGHDQQRDWQEDIWEERWAGRWAGGDVS